MPRCRYPTSTKALEELARAHDELDADGVVVYTSYDGIYLDDEVFAPLLAELDRRSAVVFVHPVAPAGSDLVSPYLPMPALEFPFDTTRLVSRVLWKRTLDIHPRIRMIIPHGGAALPLLLQRLEMLRKVITDEPLSSLTPFWFDAAGTPFPHQIPALLRVVGEERLVYGSDCCWTSPAGVRAAMATLDNATPPSGADDWRALMAANARELMSRTPARGRRHA